MSIKRTNTQIFFAVLSWLLVLACMGIIWSLSAQEATQSNAMSDGVLTMLLKFLHIESTSFVVRKLAHALEYFGLCILFSWAYETTTLKPQYVFAFFSTVAYAATDEIHQYFVPGRACQPRDVLIDALGAAVGLLLYVLLRNLYYKMKKAR